MEHAQLGSSLGNKREPGNKTFALIIALEKVDLQYHRDYSFVIAPLKCTRRLSLETLSFSEKQILIKTNEKSTSMMFLRYLKVSVCICWLNLLTKTIIHQ